MTETTIALLECLRNIGTDLATDFPREGVILMTRLLVESEVREHAAAQRYERSRVHQMHRNGYRERDLEDEGLEDPSAHSRVAPGLLLPRFPGGPKACGAGPAGRDAIGVVEGGSVAEGYTSWSRRWGCQGSTRATYPIFARSWISRRAGP